LLQQVDFPKTQPLESFRQEQLMNIAPLSKQDIPAAAALFAQDFKRFRQSLPILPDRMENPAPTAGYLDTLLAHSQALAAFEGDRLVGYLGWWLVDGFRDTGRKAAYVPVSGHAVANSQSPAAVAQTYRALYRASSEVWLNAGCQAHAITLLANDEAARQVWFWNGFGLTVVDAVRSLDPLGISAPDGYTLRRAVPADAAALAEIEAEHWRHYAEPPTLMTAYSPSSAEEFAHLLADPANSVWAAWQGAELAGYLRFEGVSHGATEIVSAPDTAACTGAYTRPAHRGRKLAAALLDAALAGYRAMSYTRCSVDFESFNPEAASFWVKYFEPVCYSMIRVPEREPE
jgi:ribosomal protein S18 acetylase RimI-like enzyme